MFNRGIPGEKLQSDNNSKQIVYKEYLSAHPFP